MNDNEHREFQQTAGILAQKIIHLCRQSTFGPNDCAFTLGLVIKSFAEIKAIETGDKDTAAHIEKMLKAFNAAVSNQNVLIEMHAVEHPDQLN